VVGGEGGEEVSDLVVEYVLEDGHC
jgi:hypothetical protein